jgi:hypothetical protein
VLPLFRRLEESLHLLNHSEDTPPWQKVVENPLEDCMIQSKKFLKKSIDTLDGLVHDASTMKKATKENPIVEICFGKPSEPNIFDVMKKYLDLIDNPKYLEAMDKIYEICSKQNPNLN